MSFGSFNDKPHTSTVNEINMVPLIDVMLVLLVIFIITAPLLAHSIQIDVPKVNAQPVEEKPNSIDIAVKETGELYWNDEQITLDELATKMFDISKQDPQPDVRIRADAGSRYENVAQVMASARNNGVKRIGFVTTPAQDSLAPSSTQEDSPARPPADKEEHAKLHEKHQEMMKHGGQGKPDRLMQEHHHGKDGGKAELQPANDHH